MNQANNTASTKVKKSLILAVPLAFFAAMSVFLYLGLYSSPTERGYQLQDQVLPPFSLPDLMQPQLIRSQNDFLGQVTLLNVWGVWCVTCAVEIPFLTGLRQQGVRIVGLYYEPDLGGDFASKSLTQVQQEVRQSLAKLGNPYAFNILDIERDYSLDLGVTGAPETFLIDQQGRIRVHHLGDINPQVWQGKFALVYQELVNE